MTMACVGQGLDPREKAILRNKYAIQTNNKENKQFESMKVEAIKYMKYECVTEKLNNIS